jgi:nitrite reductase/ring-hydroxylating ferredoxin subunit
MNSDKLAPTLHPCAHAQSCHATRIDPEILAQAQFALSRRSFVRTFALLSAASWFGGGELKSLLVAEVSAQSSTLPGIFRINLDNFPTTLANNVGSVRISVTGMPTTFAQIIISRLENNQFFAVTSRCTHEGQPVSAMNLTTRRLVCPTHGSQYQPNGVVVNGPATQPLARYNTAFDGSKIVSIEIPGLGFNVSAASVTLASNAKRMQLTFPTVSTIRYRVQFRSSLTAGAWENVPFSTTLEGAATQTVLVGNNTGATVYVDAATTTGFYAVTRANS